MVFTDYIGNAPFGINFPCAYLWKKQWNEILDRLELDVVRTKKYRFQFADPIKHIV